MKKESKYTPDGKMKDTILTTLERLDEIYTAFETQTTCDCCGGYNEHQFVGITTKLTGQELTDSLEYAGMVLGTSLLDGAMTQSAMVAGCLLVNANIGNIKFGRAVLDSLHEEQTHRDEVINKAFPAKGTAGVN